MEEYLKQHWTCAAAILISLATALSTFIRGWRSDREAGEIAKTKIIADVTVAKEHADTESMIQRQTAAVTASTALNLQTVEWIKGMAQDAISRANTVAAQNIQQQASINDLLTKYHECEQQHAACQNISRDQDDRIKKLELIVRGAKIEPY